MIIKNPRKKVKLKSIAIVFENCEHATIPSNVIHNLILRDFNQTMNYSSWNKFNVFNNCTLETLQLDKDKLKKLYSYIGDVPHENLYERISSMNDIVAIDLNLDCFDFPLTYYFPWGEDEQFNEYQETEETEDFLIISIKHPEKS